MGTKKGFNNLVWARGHITNEIEYCYPILVINYLHVDSLIRKEYIYYNYSS